MQELSSSLRLKKVEKLVGQTVQALKVLLAEWTENVHLCTHLWLTFLVGCTWKVNEVVEKSFKNGRNIL